MKKIFLIAILSISALANSFSQYNLIAISPPPLFTHEDLWNLSITRTNMLDGFDQFSIGLRIYNSNYDLEVKSNSATFSITTGSMLINLGNLNTIKPFSIQYYNSTTLQSIVSSGGLFPSGTYNIEFILLGRPSDGEFTELSSFNYQTVVETLWPPLLVTPFDNDTINTTTPTLVWSPAFSSTFMSSIQYKLNLVQIFEGQSKEQALMSNASTYMRNGLMGTFHSVTVPLKFNNNYAWSVEAHLGTQILNSQIWQFSLFDDPFPIGRSDNSFAELNPIPGSFIYIAENMKLKIRYEEEYNLPSSFQNINFKIFDFKGNVIVQNVCTGVTPCIINKGINYITLNTQTLGLVKGSFYLLEVSNLKNEKWYLRFSPNKSSIIMD